jgi:hypothetical protein
MKRIGEITSPAASSVTSGVLAQAVLPLAFAHRTVEQMKVRIGISGI